jgi:hypothetical protein
MFYVVVIKAIYCIYSQINVYCSGVKVLCESTGILSCSSLLIDLPRRLCYTRLAYCLHLKIKKSHSGNKEEEGMVSESRVSLFVRMNLRVFT